MAQNRNPRKLDIELLLYEPNLRVSFQSRVGCCLRVVFALFASNESRFAKRGVVSVSHGVSHGVSFESRLGVNGTVTHQKAVHKVASYLCR